MVVDIRNDKRGQYVFHFQSWSDYPEENEYFFIGSIQIFTFITIHHISLKLNYQAFIEPIDMFGTMMRGYPYNVHAIRNVDVKCLSVLMGNELNENISSGKREQITIYILQFFKNFVNNIQKVEIF